MGNTIFTMAAAAALTLSGLSRAATLTATIANTSNDGGYFDHPAYRMPGGFDQAPTGYGDAPVGQISDENSNALAVFRWTLPALPSGQAVSGVSLTLTALYNLFPATPYWNHLDVVAYNKNPGVVEYDDIINGTGATIVGSIATDTPGNTTLTFNGAALVSAIQASYDGGYAGIGIRVQTPDGKPYTDGISGENDFIAIATSDDNDNSGAYKPTLQFTTSAVPEPASLGMIALCGVVALRRRR